MDELRIGCHVSMSPWADGWEARIQLGGQWPQPTAE